MQYRLWNIFLILCTLSAFIFLKILMNQWCAIELECTRNERQGTIPPSEQTGENSFSIRAYGSQGYLLRWPAPYYSVAPASENSSFGSDKLIHNGIEAPSPDRQVPAENRTASSSYLRLLPMIHNNVNLTSSPIDESAKQRIEQLIREGHALKPVTTKSGDAAWFENGMIHRPWTKPDVTSANASQSRTPFSPEYETFVPFNESVFFEGRKPNPEYGEEKKIILWHTPPRYVEQVSGLNSLSVCPDFPCYVTTNTTKYLEKSSAILFSAQILPRSPPKKKPRQVFILHNHEPPYENLDVFAKAWKNGFDRKVWKEVFNWTMTFRTDSDIYVPYGIIRKRPNLTTDKNYEMLVAGKTKMVAWMVSNCNTSSAREQYVKELRKYVNVDVYGKCGSHQCTRRSDDRCSEMFSKDYKFYLSFESAICPDYITEKFFRFWNLDTIVVARGEDSYFQHAPRETFLNTANFPSPEKLAERMQYLSDNPSAYIAMLKEKDKYISLMEAYSITRHDKKHAFMTYRFESVGLCHVCQRVWNIDKYHKHNPNIHLWMKEKMCRPPNDL